jgi:hypothetical protein
MKVLLSIFDRVNRAKIPQRDRFFIYLILCLSVLINSITGLILAKQLPDLVEWVLKLAGII